MNATTVQNVVTYNTIIDFDNPEMRLFPGMTAYITIPVASATDVLRVPISALRYKPDMKAEEIRAIYQKFGLPSAGNHTAANNGPKYVGGAVKQVDRRTSAGQNEGIGLTPTSPDGVVLWKLRPDRTLEPVRIRSGITDHTVTEVAEVFNGLLNSDEDLVTGAILTGPKMGPGTANANRH